MHVGTIIDDISRVMGIAFLAFALWILLFTRPEAEDTGDPQAVDQRLPRHDRIVRNQHHPAIVRWLRHISQMAGLTFQTSSTRH
jgi:hypothetical protein